MNNYNELRKLADFNIPTGDIGATLQDLFLNRPTLMGAGVGGLGGLLASRLFGDPEDRGYMRNALKGVLLGGGTGMAYRGLTSPYIQSLLAQLRGGLQRD